MTVLVYTFNNGVYLKDINVGKPLSYKGEVLQAVEKPKNSYQIATDFFIELLSEDSFDKNLLSRKHTSIQINDYELINKGKLKGTLTSSEYENLTDYFKAFYKKGSEQEVVTFEHEDSSEVLTFDIPFTRFNESDLQDGSKDIRKYMKPQALMLDLVPKELEHLLPKVISGDSIFKLLASKLEFSPQMSKGTVRVYSYSIVVNLYERPYNNETKRQEILKQNGRPYATRQYRTVKDLPKVVSKKTYTDKMFSTLSAENEKELILKVEKLINSIIADIVD